MEFFSFLCNFYLIHRWPLVILSLFSIVAFVFNSVGTQGPQTVYPTNPPWYTTAPPNGKKSKVLKNLI